MSTLSSHVLDAVAGRPAAGVPLTLFDAAGAEVAAGVTNEDGRVAGLGGELTAGRYRLVFDTETWFAAAGSTGYYPEIAISFIVGDDDGHHHVPILLAPYSYTTYRGS